MLGDELWASIAESDELLCFDCTEARLGRRLTRRDFDRAYTMNPLVERKLRGERHSR